MHHGVGDKIFTLHTISILFMLLSLIQKQEHQSPPMQVSNAKCKFQRLDATTWGKVVSAFMIRLYKQYIYAAAYIKYIE